MGKDILTLTEDICTTHLKQFHKKRKFYIISGLLYIFYFCNITSGYPVPDDHTQVSSSLICVNNLPVSF